MLAWSTRRFHNAVAREYASHGFCRRLKSLKVSIQKVYELIPIEDSNIPDDISRHQAEIFAQNFLVNAFGALDNLARVWVHEANIKDVSGSNLSKFEIGLGKKNKVVRASFSEEFQKKLMKFDNWFEHLTNFRDALGHRIPLYIPPYSVDPKNVDEHCAVEQEYESVCVAYGRKSDRARRVEERLNSLRHFSPIYVHSFSEISKNVLFHTQMLADFNTIHDLGNSISAELDGLS